jgi:hypothetical protein
MKMSQPEPGNRDASLTAALRALAEDDAKCMGASTEVEARLLEEVQAIAAAATTAAQTTGAAENAAAAVGSADAADPRGARVAVDTSNAALAWTRGRRLAAGAGIAIAAVLLLAVIASSWRWRHSVRPQETRVAQGRAAAGAASAAGAAGAASREETATAFLPLIYSNVPITNGQVVRMEVPRTALASFGLASIDVRDGSSSGTVLADVLVGEDGLARAVRFVRAAAARQKE